MMAVDTSALVAIALDESHASACEDALKSADKLIMSAGTMAEALIVSSRRGFGAAMLALIEGFEIEIVPVNRASALRVAEAHAEWGRGANAAALNFGDCFAYELARSRDLPLLFIGDDFSRTDIIAVLPAAS